MFHSTTSPMIVDKYAIFDMCIEIVQVSKNKPLTENQHDLLIQMLEYGKQLHEVALKNNLIEGQ